MQIDELPKLAVTAVINGQVSAVFDSAPLGHRTWVAEKWWACVYVDGTFVWGRFVAVDARPTDVAFSGVSTDVAGIRVGEAYPFLDGYWGERAELVLLERAWQHARFEPRRDFIRERRANTGRMGP